MSDILPANAKLATARENAPVSQVFTAMLTEPGAALVSIVITSPSPNPGITISGDRYSGQYKSVFNLNEGIKYRLKTGERKVASSWEALPDPKTADVYSFIAPGSLEKDFSYQVEMTYDVTAPTEPGIPPGKPVRHTVKKTYTQKVLGSWTVWANNLRDYVNRGR